MEKQEEAGTVGWTARVRPRLAGGVMSLDVSDELVLYDARREIACSLNVSGRAVWELCDGRTTVFEISAALAECLACEVETLLPDVSDAVRELHRLGFLILEEADDAPADETDA